MQTLTLQQQINSLERQIKFWQIGDPQSPDQLRRDIEILKIKRTWLLRDRLADDEDALATSRER